MPVSFPSRANSFTSIVVLKIDANFGLPLIGGIFAVSVFDDFCFSLNPIVP